MKEHGIIEKQMFSLCLGKNGGHFHIGGYNFDKHISGTYWFRILKFQNSYRISATQISVGNITLPLKLSRLLIDSGTTYTYFPKKVHDEIYLQFKQFCSKT